MSPSVAMASGLPNGWREPMSWCCHDCRDLTRHPADRAVLPVLRRGNPVSAGRRWLGVPQLLASIFGDLPGLGPKRQVRMSTTLDLADLAEQANLDLGPQRIRLEACGGILYGGYGDDSPRREGCSGDRRDLPRYRLPLRGNH